MDKKVERMKKAKHKTSVTIDAGLWDEFDSQIKPRLGVRDYSPALEILIREWLNSTDSNSNAVNVQSTEALVPVLLAPPSEKRYVDAELLALQELTARVWRNKGDELAKTIISLLRIYGDISGNSTGGQTSPDAS